MALIVTPPAPTEQCGESDHALQQRVALNDERLVVAEVSE